MESVKWRGILWPARENGLEGCPRGTITPLYSGGWIEGEGGVLALCCSALASQDMQRMEEGEEVVNRDALFFFFLLQPPLSGWGHCNLNLGR